MENFDDVKYAQEEIKRKSNVAFAKYLLGIRTNFSKQADEVIKKVLNGEQIRNSDIFILTETDQERIDEAIMLDDIQDRQNSGRLTHSDIDFLIKTLGNVGEFDKTLKQAFYRKADEINLTYAINHQDEFTKEEIFKMQQKLLNSQPISEILNENTREM